MPSLKSILSELAPIFGLSPAALYERQRALVRMKLLPTPVGRGPGAGAEATPQTVALLAIACLATDNLSDTDERVRELTHAPYRSRAKRRQSCPLTGAKTFVDALAILLDRDQPMDVVVSVSRLQQRAVIIRIPHDRSGKADSEFWRPRDDIPGSIEIRAQLDPLAMNRIWRALADYRISKEALI